MASTTPKSKSSSSPAKKTKSGTTTIQQVAEHTVKEEKKKRNRPDLQNFGQEGIEAGDNTRFIAFQLKVYNLPEIDMKDADAVSSRIEEYFKICMESDMKPAVTGLALALKMSRENLWKYREEKVGSREVCNLIKRAYYLLENYWEIMMQNGKINPVSGIFLAKNHFGYQDKQDVVITPNNPLQERRTAEELAEEYALEDGAESAEMGAGGFGELPSPDGGEE